MTWLPVAVLVYGAFNVVMGLLGYFHGHSLPSLIAGAGAGILLIGCAALAKSYWRPALIAAAVIGIAIAARFAANTFKGQFYPAGIIFAASILFLIVLTVAHFTAQES